MPQDSLHLDSETRNLRFEKSCVRIRRWLDACNDHHDCLDQDQDIGTSPDWLIDVSQGCIVRGTSADKYVALSYVWVTESTRGPIPIVRYEIPEKRPRRRRSLRYTPEEVTPEEYPSDLTSASTPTKFPQRLMLRTRDLLDFQSPGFLLRQDVSNRLSSVIKDAIDLVRTLGEQYLWVDALCLVQDAPDAQVKMGLMDDIYAGAYLTVIAAVGETLEDAMIALDEDEDDTAKPVSDNAVEARKVRLYQRLLKTKWATRGWTFQEQVLSRRAVIFVEGGDEGQKLWNVDGLMFWECGHTIWDTGILKPDSIPKGQQSDIDLGGRLCQQLRIWDKDVSVAQPTRLVGNGSFRCLRREIVPKSRFHEEPRMLDMNSDRSKRISAVDLHFEDDKTIKALQLVQRTPVSKKDFRTWFELVCLYNGRDFTYPHDTLLAFSGILNSLTAGFSGGFICGLPVDFLDVALIWQPAEPVTLRIAHGHAGGSPTYIPSWSPFGWKCSIDPYSLRSGLARLDYQDNQQLAASWRTQSLVQWTPVEELTTSLTDGKPVTIGPCLRGRTMRAFLDATAFVTYVIQDPRMCHPSDYIITVPKVPIMSLFTLDEPSCKIIWLCSNERKVGLLRSMDSHYNDSLPPNTKVELIATSMGTATRGDLAKAYEEKDDQTNISNMEWDRDVHRKRAAKGVKNQDSRRPPPLSYYKSVDPEWYHQPYYEAGSADTLVEFYNVLWIERQGEVALRKAAGRVLKSAWDECCSDTVEITLA